MSQTIVNLLIENTLLFSALFGGVLLVRFVFKKHLSALMQYALWAVVVIRLLIPISYTAEWSPVNLIQNLKSAQPLIQTVDTANATSPSAIPQLPDQNTDSYADIWESAPTAAFNADPAPDTVLTPAAPPLEIDLTAVVVYVWLAGILLYGTWLGLNTFKLKTKIRRCTTSKAPQWMQLCFVQCKDALGIKRDIPLILQGGLPTPAIMGIFKPVLILPDTLIRDNNPEQMRHIFTHELMHYKRKDLPAIWGLNILNAAYWFNPLVWLCCRLICRDMETACDHMVVQSLGSDQRREYIQTILKFSETQSNMRTREAMSLNDGCTRMQKRIRGMYMKKKTKPAIRTAVLALALVMAFAAFTSGCQPTPVNNVQSPTEYVSAQSAEPAQEIQEKSLRERLAAPLEWRESIKLDDKLIVDMNADITVPQVKNVSAYEVAPKEITQEMVNQYIKTLFGGAPIYEQRPNDTLTQEDIVNQANDIRNFLDRLKIDDPDRYSEEAEHWNARIEELLASIKNYPEAYALKPSDGKFRMAKKFADMPEETNPDILKIAIQADLGKNYPAYLNIQQSGSFKESELIFSNTNTFGSDVRLKMDEVQNPIGLTMPFDEALELAGRQLKELGLDNYDLEEAYYGVFGDGPYVTNPLPIKDRNPYYYSLYFSQKKDGIPMSYTSQYRGVVPADKAEIESWGAEAIQVNVDNDGIFAISWRMPAAIKNAVNGTVEPQNFGSIDKIILDGLKQLYTLPFDMAEVNEIELHVEKIEFAYTRCLKQNSQSEYILTPCWNVYGNIQTYYNKGLTDPNNDENNSYTESKPMGTLLTVNAINGSLLNTEMGF